MSLANDYDKLLRTKAETGEQHAELCAKQKAFALLMFEAAIAQGRLSRDRAAANFAGSYMFMGIHETTDKALFKNRNTRAYLD